MRLLRGEDILIANVEVASSLWSRTKGLLGRAGLPEDQALWIKPCNSVHTYFMRFPIDLVFVDSKLRVRRTFARVEPGRLIWPVWGASSVFECTAGFLDRHPLLPGEHLHVDPALS